MDESLKNQVIGIFEKDQSQLNGALDNQSTITAPSTLEKVSITQNSDGTWNKTVTTEESGLYDGSVDSTLRNQVKNEAEILQKFCREVDNQILAFNSQINDKKDLIITLSNEAAAGNCWPGIAYSTTTSTGIVRKTGVGAATSSFIRNAVEVNNEIENIKIYTKMAGPQKDYNAQNVFEPDTIVAITTAYTGYGYQNLRDPNYYQSNDGTLTGSLTDGSGISIGTGRFDLSTVEADHSAPAVNVATFGGEYTGTTFFAYAGAGVAPEATDTTMTAARCVGIANSISTVYDEIIELRKQRDSLRSDLNTIKKKKMEKELASWGMNRIESEITTRSSTFSSVISSVKNFNTDGTVNVQSLVLNLDAGDTDSYNVSGINTAWTDLSGYNNNAVLEPTNSPATFEYSDDGFLTFNGTDEYAETVTKSSDILGTGGEWTIETWFRINGAPSDNTLSNVIVDVNPTGGTATMLNVTYGTAGTFAGLSTNTFTYSSRPTSGDSYTHLQGPEITNDLWYHGVVVRNGDTNTKLYVNGSLSSTHEGNLPANSEGFARIARWTDGTSFANISVSVVKIYQRSFTDAEIKDKFDGSKSRFGLIG